MTINIQSGQRSLTGLSPATTDDTYSLAETGRKILAPNYPGEDKRGKKQKAILTPKTLSRFVTDYNNHLLPDAAHLPNVMENKYAIPRNRVAEAIEIILANAEFAGIVERREDGSRLRLEGVASTAIPPSHVGNGSSVAICS